MPAVVRRHEKVCFVASIACAALVFWGIELNLLGIGSGERKLKQRHLLPRIHFKVQGIRD